MTQQPPSPTWGVWGHSSSASSDSLSSTAASNNSTFHHRRGASLPSTFLFALEEEDVPSPLPPPTGAARPRLGQRAVQQQQHHQAVRLEDPAQPPHHRRVGSNPLDSASLFGPNLLPGYVPSPPIHRRSVTFDAMDLSNMASALESASSPLSPIIQTAAAVTPIIVTPLPVPAVTTTAVPPAPPQLISNQNLQAQLAMQQQLILQQQQWLMAMQQQQSQQQLYYPPQHHHHASSTPYQMYSKPHSNAATSSRRAPPLPHQHQSANHHHQQSDVLLQEYKQSGIRPAIDALIANGSVNAFALDAHGSRFLQYQMEICLPQEKEDLVTSSLDNCIALMQDTFGNYVMQNFFAHSSPSMRSVLAERMHGSMLTLTIDPHGCRVVQRMLDLVDLSVRNSLLDELISGERQNVFVAARNTHGTHVLQKTVSMLRRDGLPQSKILLGQMESQISLDVIGLLLHPNSYRLVLNVLGDCDRTARPNLDVALETILTNQDQLSRDQHGNFILQHLLEVPNEGQRVLNFVLENLVELSKHKFASHLVEKCFAIGSNQVCAQFVEELLRPQRNGKQSQMLELMTDPYANFVVQKAFDRLGGNVGQFLKTEMVTLVQTNAELLGKYTYGRHILGHVVNQVFPQPPPPTSHHHHRQSTRNGSSSGRQPKH
ncbi:hypothetical protein BASA81_000238 [Batrachochytrium salamandrivorans]|nr:hypothetical protein BASA81_000238 [Batrachochytrium salamandrivorans]